MSEKQCTLCKVLKPLTQYYALHTVKDGKRARCKNCDRLVKRDYYDKNRKILNKKSREYWFKVRRANPERFRKYQKEWRERNHEKALQYCRNFRKRNPDYGANKAKIEYNQLKDKIFDVYGKECMCCKESRRGFLTLDHVNRDGAAHRKILGSRSIFRDLKQKGFPKEGYQILCMNCNFATRYGAICPHKLS